MVGVGNSTWRRFLAAGLVGAVLCAVTTGDSRGLVGQVIRMASVVAMVMGIRTWGRGQGRAWHCFAVGGASVLLGNFVLVAVSASTGDPNPFPSPADAFFVLGYLAIIAGEILLVRRRSAHIEGDNLIDSLILVSCVGVVVWAMVLSPYARDPSLRLVEKAFSGGYSLLTLTVVGVGARLAVGSGRRNPSYYFLAGSFAFLLASDVLTTLQTADGTSGAAALVSSVLSYVLLATAALHPSMARLTDRPAEREIQLTRRRLGLLFAAMLMVPALLVLHAAGYDGASVQLLAGGAVLLTVLVLARLAGLVRAKERMAERERILREAGEALVAATDREQMHEAALNALAVLVGAGSTTRVSVMTASADGFTVVASKGEGAGRAMGTRVAMGALPAAAREAFSSGRTVVLDGGPAPDLVSSPADPDDHPVLLVPLSSKGEVRGVVVICTYRLLAPERVTVVEELAQQLALAVESAALTEEIALRRHERRFRALVEHSSDLVSVIGPDGVASFVSPASTRLLGVPESEMTGRHPFERMHPDDRAQASALLDRSWAIPGLREPIEARLRHENGDWRWFEIVTDNLLDDPEVEGMVIHARDVTDRKLAQLRLQESEARFRSLVQHASDLVMVLRDDLTMGYVSPSVGRVLGHTQGYLTGRCWSELVHPDDVAKAEALAEATTGRHNLEVRVCHHDGSWRTLDLTVSDLRHDPAVGGIVLNGRDVSERQQLEHQLRHQAHHDGLTGLANRTLFTQRVSEALSRRTGPLGGIAVLFIDLDDFKTVNDGLGHSAGDALLGQVASRMEWVLRSGDVAARLGGDEFAVLLENVTGEAGVLDIFEVIQDSLRTPFMIDGREVNVTASIGIAFDRREASSADVLLRNADVAMYQAKSRGKNRHELFEAGMQTLVYERLQLKGDLASGLEQDQFQLLYQPIVSLPSGEITGVEALVRWHHHRLGVLPPDNFVPLAEETGFIVPLGRQLLEQACAQLQRWHRRYPQRALSMSVNVSVRQLEAPEFLDHVRDALERFDLPPSSLGIEITESVLMADVDMACHRLSQLKELGVVVAVDDFGTGYSSIGYLQVFPVDVVKIDRSIIKPLGRRAQQANVVRAIIDLARSHGLGTVAEGVEDGEQVTLLHALGCETAQGYHFSRPVTAAAVEALLDRVPARPVVK